MLKKIIANTYLNLSENQTFEDFEMILMMIFPRTRVEEILQKNFQTFDQRGFVIYDKKKIQELLLQGIMVTAS